MKTVFLLLAAQFIVGASYAQAQRDFASLDAVAYLRGNDSVIIEAYYSLVQKSLKFSTADDKKWIAPIIATVVVRQDGKEIAKQEINKQTSFTGSQAQLQEHQTDVLVDAAFFRVPAKSSTEIMLVVSGVDTKNQPYSDSIIRQVNIPVRKSGISTFGGIELASSIQKTTDASNLFEKVGYIIYPNPSGVFGGNFQKLYYYTELDLPPESVSKTEKGEVLLRILDGEDHEMYKSKQEISLDAEYVPILGSISVDGLPSDIYKLELRFVRNGEVKTNIQRTFYYDSGFELSEESDAPTSEQGTVDENTLYLSSDFSRYSEFELEERGDQSALAMPEAVKSNYNKLKVADEKRHFLFEFWRMKDRESPRAEPLSSYRAFLKRVEEANKKFTAMKLPGWKSSRGRVLLKYGKPDDVQTRAFGIDTKPYEIWEYSSRSIALNSGSRAQFVFVDKQGAGNYILVHSNALGETSQPNWYTREALQTTN